MVKPGYKQTEVGVIPEDWLDYSVGELIAEGIIEKPLDGNHGNIHPKSGDFVDYGIPFVMANNVQGGRVDLTNCSFIRKEQADSLQKGFSKTGDVLLTHKATIGNTALVGEIPFDYIMLTPQVTYYRVADKNRLSNCYLRQYFDSSGFQSVLRNLSGGGTRSYIGIKAQHQLPVVLPSNLEEQQAIAAALSDADKLIGSLEQLLTKKRQIKQGAMQELLTGKKRLPGFTGEWGVTILGSLLTMKATYGIVTTGDFKNTGVPMIRAGDIKSGKIGRDMPLVSAEKSSEYSRTVLKRDDVVIGLVGYPGEAAKVPSSLEGANISRAVGLLRLTNHISPSYLVSYLNSPIGRRMVLAPSAGSAQLVVNLSELNKLSFSLPSLTEQNAIAEVLSDMDAEIEALETKLTKARQVKQGMMQELLTGRIRLV